MLLKFRQGVIGKPTNAFQATPSGVNLVISNNRPLELSLIHKTLNYYHAEQADVANAWSVQASPTPVWLYVDIDSASGQRTFGVSQYDIVSQATAPTSPVFGMHWFDTVNNVIKFRSTSSWIEVIRIFVAKYQGGVLTDYKPVGTSHFNLTGTSIPTGRILYDNTGTAIRTSVGGFLTSEVDFFTYGGIANAVRMESDITTVRANETIPAYSVVAITSYNSNGYANIVLADYTNTNQTIVAICTQGLDLGEVANIVTRGLITNVDWDWEADNAPIGTRLWIGTGLQKGTLVKVDPAALDPLLPHRPAVAKVLNHNSVLFQQSFEDVGVQGQVGEPGEGAGPATTLEIGSVALSVSPIDPDFPVVVGDNDPRLTDARPPTSHTHIASSISTAAFGPYGISDTQSVLQGIHTAKLDKAGGTMTGNLILNGDPVSDLQAVPKQYVTDYVETTAVLMTGTVTPMVGDLILNGPPIIDNQAATKRYVDDLITNLGTAVTGSIFITNAVPQTTGTVGNKIMTGGALTSFESTTQSLTITVVATSGPTSLIPIATVNGVAVLDFVLSNGMWQGTANITLPGTGSNNIVADHADGATFTSVANVNAGPVIKNATFAGAGLVYTSVGATTSLKAAVIVPLTVVVDAQVTQIEIMTDTGTNNAATPQIFTVAPVVGVGLPLTYTYTVSATVANNGNIATNRSVTVRANKSGVWGASYNTTTSRDTLTYPTPVNEVHFVSCDNLHPSIVFGGIVYPGSQQALKGSESATVTTTITNASGVNYTSPNSDLSITAPTTNSATKTVTRIAGSYNVSTSNLQVVATRSANNASSTSATVVQIANTAPTVTISTPAARLRSGGQNGSVAQNHTITITSSQKLLNAPSLVAPLGTWQGAGFVDSGNALIWTRSLQIDDSMLKGSYTFNTLSATNLAGIVVTTVTGSADYNVGGFVSRKCFFDPFQNISSIGTPVVTAAKLSADDFDGITMTYQNGFGDATRTYTVVTGMTLDPTGDTIYWTDSVAVNNNTTGLVFIEIEELV